jgi:hypothetical protein
MAQIPNDPRDDRRPRQRLYDVDCTRIDFPGRHGSYPAQPKRVTQLIRHQLARRSGLHLAVYISALCPSRIAQDQAVPRKKPKLVAWEIIQIGASGRLLGVVHAPDEAAALKAVVDRRDRESARRADACRIPHFLLYLEGGLILVSWDVS